MRIRTFIFLLFFSCLACHSEREEKSESEDPNTEFEITFDKTKWSLMDDKDYPYRDQMLNDVLYNDSIRTLIKYEILELLGEPDRSTDGYLYYMISQTRIGAWPLRTKTMVIRLSEDSSIDWIKIHE